MPHETGEGDTPEGREIETVKGWRPSKMSRKAIIEKGRRGGDGLVSCSLLELPARTLNGLLGEVTCAGEKGLHGMKPVARGG